jgi:transcriptional regulator with XRE-family HTH domain
MAATQAEVARRVGLDVSSVNKILNRRPGHVFKKSTVEKVFRAAKELGYSLERLRRSHGRSHERRQVDFSAKIALHGADGSQYDQGTCSVSDIAICGASLVDVQLPKSTLPVEPFTIRLEMTGQRNELIEVRGRVVRLNHAGKSLRLGIAFQDVGPALEIKIVSLTRNRRQA